MLRIGRQIMHLQLLICRLLQQISRGYLSRHLKHRPLDKSLETLRQELDLVSLLRVYLVQQHSKSVHLVL